MPKFVWIAELTTPDLVDDKKAVGMILLDATEPNQPEVLATLIKNLYLGKINDKHGAYSLPLPPFSIINNLKPF